MKRLLLALFVVVAGAASIFSSSSYTVLKDSINVRVDSTVLSDSLGYLSQGDEVTVLGEKYDWYRIILPQRFTCYIAAEFAEKIESRLLKVTGSGVNLRSSPTLESPIIGVAPKDTTFRVLEYGKEWIKISGYPYAQGWVHKKFLKEGETEKENLSLLVEEAVAELANPDIAKKQILHEKLIKKGEEIIPLLESYLSGADTNTVYSIIAVLTAFVKDNPTLVSYFLMKTKDAQPKIAALYFDVIQEAVAPANGKVAYFYLAEKGELSAEDIEKVRRVFEEAYQKSLADKNEVNAVE